MDKFTTHTGVGVPLRRSDVDTDQIIPAEYLKRVARSGFEDGLFAAWRGDSEFILNQDAYSAGTVLIAGPNFGTGSSREHAVWALQNYGFKAVISPRFGDIFKGNSGKAGLLVVQLSEEVVEQLWAYLEATPGAEVTIDLENQLVSTPGGEISASFEIDPYTKWRLINGLDDVGITLSHEEDITAFEAKRFSWKAVTM